MWFLSLSVMYISHPSLESSESFESVNEYIVNKRCCMTGKSILFLLFVCFLDRTDQFHRQTHSHFANTHKIFANSNQSKSNHWKEKKWRKLSSVAELLLTFDSWWKGGSQFYLMWLLTGGSHPKAGYTTTNN